MLGGEKLQLKGICDAVDDDKKRVQLLRYDTQWYRSYKWADYDEIKLLLRPLSSMTEEEAIAMYDHLFPEVNRSASFKAKIILDQLSDGIYYEGKVSIHDYIQWVKYLIDPDRAFDIFGLIDAKLALDATKIEKV